MKITATLGMEIEQGSHCSISFPSLLIYKDWSGSAVENSFRINVTYTIPVN